MRQFRGIAGSLLSLLFFLGLAPSAKAYGSILEQLRETQVTVRALSLPLAAIPRGAQGVRLLSLDFHASRDGPVAVKEVRVHLVGRGDAASIRGVYLLRGVERLNRSVAFSSDDRTAVLRPGNLMISAGGSVRMDVAMDLSPDVAVGSEYRVEILAERDIVTDADKLSGSFPLRNRMPLAKGSITPQAAGALTVTFTPLSGKLRTVIEQTLAKFTVTADNESHHLLYAIMLTNEGSAKGEDLRNLFLTTRGSRALTQVATAMTGDTVTLQFSSPYFLRKGDTIGLELHGRAFTGTKTVNFLLKEASDLRAIPSRRRL